MHGDRVSFIVRVAKPAEYAEAGQVAAGAYRADDLVAVDDGQVLGTVTWCPPRSPWRELATRPDQAEFRMLSVAGVRFRTRSRA